MSTLPLNSDDRSSEIAAYKLELRAIIDRRPSGTRQKLAEAFGTHKSFITQITNPKYSVPLPAQHVPALLQVCRLTETEHDRFMALYAAAHPGQVGAMRELADAESQIVRIVLPDFKDEALRTEVENSIREFAERLIAIAKRGEEK